MHLPTLAAVLLSALASAPLPTSAAPVDNNNNNNNNNNNEADLARRMMMLPPGESQPFWLRLGYRGVTPPLAEHAGVARRAGPPPGWAGDWPPTALGHGSMKPDATVREAVLKQPGDGEEMEDEEGHVAWTLGRLGASDGRRASQRSPSPKPPTKIADKTPCGNGGLGACLPGGIGGIM